MKPTGFESGPMPTLCRFDSIDTFAPPAKKPRFQHIERVTEANNYLPSSCDNCLDDMQTVFNHSMDLLRARKTTIVPGEDYSKLMKSLSAFKEMITSELDRFVQYEGGAVLNEPAANAPAAMYTPDSPVSETASTPVPLDIKPSPGCRTSTEGVVHGTGVIADQNFAANEDICLYDGPLVCRILNQNSGKYYVFRLKDVGNDGLTDIEFLDSDTYVAWAGVVIAKAGRPAIEIGRDCDHDIRFLNHSKDPNVMIRFRGKDTISWSDRDSLRLTVVALKDIKSGEELLFDYDENKPDSEIDFSLSAVESVNEEHRDKIINRINGLDRKQSGIGQKKPARTMQKEVVLPKILDDEIVKIMEEIDKIHTSTCHPANIHQMKKSFSDDQKKLLNIIFSGNESILEDLASYLSSLKSNTAEDLCLDELTEENIQGLVKYLKRSIFNEKQTWVSVEELKENFASFK
ncbi:SET domain-containing protein-lysine N-methyltransferase [Endozoicomonas sp. SESOKO1]|uniref:SET domain-containing protein-lysine N-methyltransferase n=1 Tax=Endozoicomonas sp. SESOKO1 TaxID=2828742 RepID=UPI0021491971|nr:SET domain-containing protein [Endozoicomonas sp. SESOKO1]